MTSPACPDADAAKDLPCERFLPLKLRLITRSVRRMGHK
jgi:hypothetical protein